MIYKNIHEAKEAFRNYQDFDSEEEIECFTYSDKHRDIKIGDFLLFQHIKNKTISRPILGLFVGFSWWDQAFVMSFVEVPRAYYFSDKYQVYTNEELEIVSYIGYGDPEVENIQFWTDNILFLGHFKSRPKLDELREALKNKALWKKY